MKRESIRERKRSFIAMLAAVLVFFNMMPLGAIAKEVYFSDVNPMVIDANGHSVPIDDEYKVSQFVRLDPGDKLHCCDSPNHDINRWDSGYIIYDGSGTDRAYMIPFTVSTTIDITGRSYILSYWYPTGTEFWLRSIFNVTFDSNGGGSNPADQEVIWNEKANRPADPTKEGDTFVKWVKVKNGTETDWDFNTSVTEDITLRAKWLIGNSTSQSNESDPNHTHSYTWKISKEPTATSDGEEIYVCECGHIAQTNVLPGSAAFEADIIAKIKKAPANGIVTIETRIWNSLSKDVRDALVERPDVTLKISFLSEGYKGIPLKVTIPTGIDRYALWDEKGWLGLCRAGSTLGYDQ